MQDFDYSTDYIKGKSNIVAEALFRRYSEVHDASSNIVNQVMSFAMVTVSRDTLQILEEGYQHDEFFRAIFENPVEPCTKNGTTVLFQKRLCIPKGELRRTILQYNHESLFVSHRGSNKNYFTYIKALLLGNYQERYPQLRETCLSCQEAKSTTQNQLGNLSPFPPPTKKWEVISMDFIFDSPKTTEGTAAVRVVVDKLSKRTHFAPLRSDNSAKNIATTFYKEI